MRERLGQRFVGFGEVNVLANHADPNGALGMIERPHQSVPEREIRWRRVESQQFAENGVDLLFLQNARHFIDAGDVGYRHHRIDQDIREERNLGALFVRYVSIGPAQQEVRLDPDLAQFLHRVLGWFGLKFASRRNKRNKGQVDETGIATTEFQTHLPDGLKKRQGFNIPDGAANLDDGDLCRLWGANASAALDKDLNFVRYVRDHLHGPAEVFAPAFFANHRFVDLTGRKIVGTAHLGRHKTLVMAQIKIGLGPIFGDEHFAVLKRAHRARVDVDVGVELEHRDAQPARFEQCGDRGGGDPFTQRGHDAASHEYELSHGWLPPRAVSSPGRHPWDRRRLYAPRLASFRFQIHRRRQSRTHL